MPANLSEMITWVGGGSVTLLSPRKPIGGIMEQKLEASEDVKEALQGKSEAQQLPTEAELVQAVRIALGGTGAAHQLLNTLDALREGRLEYRVWNNYAPPVGYKETPYKNVFIRKS